MVTRGISTGWVCKGKKFATQSALILLYLMFLCCCGYLGILDNTEGIKTRANKKTTWHGKPKSPWKSDCEDNIAMPCLALHRAPGWWKLGPRGGVTLLHAKEMPASYKNIRTTLEKRQTFGGHDRHMHWCLIRHRYGLRSSLCLFVIVGYLG